MADEADTELLGLTATIVSAHIRNNQVAATALPELIQSVWRSLATAGTAKPKPAPAPLTPAVPIRKSVLPDYIVCPGGREEAEDAQAAPAGQLRNDA